MDVLVHIPVTHEGHLGCFQALQVITKAAVAV